MGDGYEDGLDTLTDERDELENLRDEILALKKQVENLKSLSVLIEGGLVRGVYDKEGSFILPEPDVYDLDTFDGGDVEDAKNLLAEIDDTDADLRRDIESYPAVESSRQWIAEDLP